MNEIVETVAELEAVESGDAVEGAEVEVTQEEAGMVLLEVIQAAIATALDAGLTSDVKEIRILFNEDGGVSVLGVDQENIELETVVSSDEILEILDY
jgi:hypothetical protein